MKKGLIFLVALLVLLSATAITFARKTTATSVTITAGGIAGYAADDLSGLAAIPADIALKHSTGLGPANSHAPAWSPVVERPGSVTAGDIYYLNTKTYTGDIYVTVYLTNADALRLDYNYLNLNVMVYSSAAKPVLAADWGNAATVDGTEIPVYLSLVNGSVSFYLAGDSYYTIGVAGGDYYCIDTDAVGGSLSPDATSLLELKRDGKFERSIGRA